MCKHSVPYAALSWCSECIDRCWLWASSLTLLWCPISSVTLQLPEAWCRDTSHPVMVLGAEAASSTGSDRASAEYNVGTLKETRVAQSWAFMVWEHREWTIRPVLPKPVQSGNCLLPWGSWWVTPHLRPTRISLLPVVLSLVLETHCRFPQDA